LLKIDVFSHRRMARNKKRVERLFFYFSS